MINLNTIHAPSLNIIWVVLLAMLLPGNLHAAGTGGDWAQQAFSDEAGVARPFGFKYGGRDWSDLRGDWKFQARPAGESRKTLEWYDPSTGLAVTCEVRLFPDYPEAQDWVLWFENRGDKNTPIIDKIRSLDFPLSGAFPFTVHGANGGRSEDSDFMPLEFKLNDAQASVTLFSSVTSSNNHLPFFAVDNGQNSGVIVGVGWSGEWRANFLPENGKLRISAGLTNSHFYLKPGEKIRAARILLMPWQGELENARNQFRRLLHEHYVPKFKGKPQQPFVTVNTCFTYDGKGNFLEKANESNVLPLVEPFAKMGAEAMVIDACWYEGDPWIKWMGNWRPSRTRYPNGFKAISDALRKHDMYFGLWFTPEVVSPTVPMAREHPEWLFPGQTAENYGLSMARPEARKWFLDQVDELVTKSGLTFYRNDFAIVKYPDPPDRVGFYECEHVAGLYQLWDTLRERYPGMVMEGCMGGGRRIDIETVQRFLWHQKSDLWFHTEADQAGMYGANFFLPGGLINVPTTATDDYGAWSSFAGQFCLGWDPINPNFPHEKAKEQVTLYKKIRHLLSGDYHPLTPYSLDKPWIAFQFHRPDLNEGVAMIYRRRGRKTEDLQINVKLKGLKPSAKYQVHHQARGQESTLAGVDLMNGTTIKMKSAPAAELLLYKEQQ